MRVRTVGSLVLDRVCGAVRSPSVSFLWNREVEFKYMGTLNYHSLLKESGLCALCLTTSTMALGLLPSTRRHQLIAPLDVLVHL
jgi:hypothetical protein